MKEYTGGQLQQQIIDLGHILGWHIAHFRPALTKHGYRTAVSADGKGFPDLLMVKPPRIIAYECKSRYEKVSPEQEHWLELFGACTGVLAHVVRPQDWESIEKELKGEE